MNKKHRFVLVMVTAPDLRGARKLARAALEARLVACANLVPKIESHYWWKGRLEKSAEILILLKTPTRLAAALERFIVEKHPYETPEFIALGIDHGNRAYLKWCEQSTR
jgi:periplasmic divalent cation tolerance protein